MPRGKLRTDPAGKPRVAEPVTLGAGAVAAIVTAVNSNDYKQAVTLLIVAALPYVMSYLTDRKRAA